MMRAMNHLRIGLVVALAAGFLSFSPTASGGETKPTLRYMKTYESAMLESRIRGLPIFFSRHKDF